MTTSRLVGGKTEAQTAQLLSGDRPVKQVFLTVLETPPFTLELVTLSASVEQNQSTSIEVMAQRRDGFAGDIKLTAEGFSAGREPLSKRFEGGEATLKASEPLG